MAPHGAGSGGGGDAPSAKLPEVVVGVLLLHGHFALALALALALVVPIDVHLSHRKLRNLVMRVGVTTLLFKSVYSTRAEHSGVRIADSATRSTKSRCPGEGMPQRRSTFFV